MSRLWTDTQTHRRKCGDRARILFTEFAIYGHRENIINNKLVQVQFSHFGPPDHGGGGASGGLVGLPTSKMK